METNINNDNSVLSEYEYSTHFLGTLIELDGEAYELVGFGTVGYDTIEASNLTVTDIS